MNSESRGKEFPIAQKIYGALLRAYPSAHRAAYGGAMAQLFRDQCRDAWSKSKNFGLLKLWLRVLPDLVSTSIMERLAALNERKSMNEKLASLSSFQIPPAKVFSRVFVVVFLTVFIVSAAATFILPESFASTAQILVRAYDNSTNHVPEYDPYLLQKQFEFIHSATVLVPVINELNLNELWAKKYFAGEKLKPEQTLELLKNRLAISPVRNTTIVSIQAYSDDKNESAIIANAVADSYFKQLTNGQMAVLVQDPKACNINMVSFLERAAPGKYSVRPNRPLNIALGGFFGLLLAGAIGGAAFFITKLRQRNRAPAALAES